MQSMTEYEPIKNTLTRYSTMGKDFNDKRLEILFLGIKKRQFFFQRLHTVRFDESLIILAH